MRPLRTTSVICVAAALLFAIGPSPLQAKGYPPRKGKPHPQLVFPNAAGGAPIALSHYRGKKVLLVHFAPWSQASREKLPKWNEATRPFVDDGKLVVLGIAQGQYADRCQLYAQWKDIHWPILHDIVNRMDIKDVPIIVALDEHGIVRKIDMDAENGLASFVKETFKAPKKKEGEIEAPPLETLPDTKRTRRDAGEARQTPYWCEHGNALILAGKPQQIDEAITTFQNAVKSSPRHAASWFGLGAAYRTRYDRPERRPGDFQAAIDAWQKAAALKSSNAIYNARVQQYGPQADQPHGFYDWVRTARKELHKRGVTPIPLAVEPVGTECLAPDHKADAKTPLPEGDPLERATKDTHSLVQIETTVVRATEKSKQRYLQVYVTLRPNVESNVRWNDDAAPPRLWVEDPPKNVRVDPACVTHEATSSPSGTEPRTLSFEVRLPKKKKKGTIELTAYAIYVINIGEGETGTSLRQDITLKIPIKQ